MSIPEGFKVESSGMPQGFKVDRQNLFERTFRPRREDFKEHPSFTNLSPEEALRVARGEGELRPRDADPNAALDSDMYGNPVISMNGQKYYLNRPGPSFSDIGPAVGKIVGAVEEAAPYLQTGVASAPMGAAKAMAAQAVTGLAEESIDQGNRAVRGEDVEWHRLATTPLVAAAGEGGGRALAAALSPLIRRLVPNSTPQILNRDGTFTDDAIEALKKADMSPSELDDIVSHHLKNTDVLDDAQAQRFNLFKKYFNPTRAQVTRSADDFQQQQELYKTSGPVRQTLEGQEARLSNAFDDVTRGTGGRPTTSSSTAADAVIGKATQLDDEIRALYQQADSVAGGDAVVRLDSFVDTVRRAQWDDSMSGGLMTSIKGDLINKGIIDDEWRVVGRVSPRSAERVRQFLNERYTSTNAIGRQYINRLKETLDDDVFRTVGDDIYNQARQAKANFHKGLATDKVSRFDQNTNSLVLDILENKIKPDDVFEQAVLSKRWKPKDLGELRKYLMSGSDSQVTAGAQAWNDLKAEALGYIKNTAFVGPVDENGYQKLSRAALERAFGKIGQGRLKVLFNDQERKFFSDMLKIAKLREPVSGTYLGKGPTAQAVEELRRSVVDKFPLIGRVFDKLQLAADGRLMVNPTEGTVNAMTRANTLPIRSRITSPAASAAITGERILQDTP